MQRNSALDASDPFAYDALEALIVTFAPMFGGRDRVDARTRPDGRIELADRDGGRRVLAQPVSRPSHAIVLDAWHALRASAHDARAVPALVVPRLSRTLRELVEREHVNWVDLATNAHITDPALLVHVDAHDPQPAWSSRGVDPFAPRSSNVVRQLLAAPGRRWRQKDLVDRTGVSQPQVSKVIAALRTAALVEADYGEIEVADPSGLLDAWADAYRYGRQRIVPAHVSGEGVALADDLHDRLRAAGVAHWFTGLPAAWAYDRFARFRLVSVFVDANAETVRRELGLREAPRGANVHLIATGPQRIDIGATTIDALPVAHPAQVYVDLLGLPERAHEAAEHLRPIALGERRA